MKIAIGELNTPAEIADLDRTTATEVVGGETFGATTVELAATGSNAFTDAYTFSATFDIPLNGGGTHSITVTGGIGIASDNGPVGLEFDSFIFQKLT